MWLLHPLQACAWPACWSCRSTCQLLQHRPQQGCCACLRCLDQRLAWLQPLLEWVQQLLLLLPAPPGAGWSWAVIWPLPPLPSQPPGEPVVVAGGVAAVSAGACSMSPASMCVLEQPSHMQGTAPAAGRPYNAAH